MKKTTLLLAAALLAAGTVQAQDWKDALKKAATSVADQLTDGKLTEHALVGTWSYTGPGVKFEGEDMASELAGAAIESSVAKQLERAYALADRVHFENAFCRRDIGRRALEALRGEQ